LLPEDGLEASDMITRWYVIGKNRFENELNIEKLLKLIRSLRMHTNFTREAKASMSLKDTNIIEVDSDENMKVEVKKVLSKAIRSFSERNSMKEIAEQ